MVAIRVFKQNMSDIEILIANLKNAPRIIIPLTRGIKLDLLKRRPQPDKWSAHEHACHLAQVHPLFFNRLDLMLREENPTIKPYFPDKDEEDDLLLKVDFKEALERFTNDRQTLVEKLKSLKAEDWLRTAIHEEYAYYSIYIMFRHLSLHDFMHAYRIEEIVLARNGIIYDDQS